MRKGEQKGAVVMEETLAALPYQRSALANKDLCSFSKGRWGLCAVEGCSRCTQSAAFELAPGKLCSRLFWGKEVAASQPRAEHPTSLGFPPAVLLRFC